MSLIRNTNLCSEIVKGRKSTITFSKQFQWLIVVMFKNTLLSSRLRLPSFIFRWLDLITSFVCQSKRVSCDQVSVPHVHIYRLWSSHLLIFSLLDKQSELLGSITVRHGFQTFHHPHGFSLWTLSNSCCILLQLWKSALRTTSHGGAKPLASYLAAPGPVFWRAAFPSSSCSTHKQTGQSHLLCGFCGRIHQRLACGAVGRFRGGLWCPPPSPTPPQVGAGHPLRLDLWELLGESTGEAAPQRGPRASPPLPQALGSQLATDGQSGGPNQIWFDIKHCAACKDPSVSGFNLLLRSYSAKSFANVEMAGESQNLTETLLNKTTFAWIQILK